MVISSLYAGKKTLILSVKNAASGAHKSFFDAIYFGAVS
jgi:hypothetical protein